jgi:hypothetical protein
MAIAKGMTIEEATKYWIRGFNAIPQPFIVEALKERLWDEFTECYPNLKVCRSCSAEFTEEEYKELVERFGDENDVECPHCNDNQYGIIDYAENSQEHDDFLPMWGTMWTFEEKLDEDWALDNLEIMYQCGFRIYEHEDLGVVIGIDGAGYDFYEGHWIPLYKARGLRWHDTEE